MLFLSATCSCKEATNSRRQLLQPSRTCEYIQTTPAFNSGQFWSLFQSFVLGTRALFKNEPSSIVGLVLPPVLVLVPSLTILPIHRTSL